MGFAKKEATVESSHPGQRRGSARKRRNHVIKLRHMTSVAEKAGISVTALRRKLQEEVNAWRARSKAGVVVDPKSITNTTSAPWYY